MNLPRNDKNFIKEFARRSKTIYEAGKNNTDFEVTALINCALGLFIIPKERIVNIGTISDTLFQRFDNLPRINTYTKIFDKAELIRHIRNSLAHGKFEFNVIGDNIKTIIIKDERGQEKFEMYMPIDLFKEFVLNYADSIINIQ